MTRAQEIDVSQLPDYSISTSAPLWWGQLLMAVIEGSMFLILIAIYFYLRISLDVWPPPGTQLPHLTKSTLALVPLILSCWGSYWASEGARKNSRRDMLVGMIVNVVLAAAYLAFRTAQWHDFNFGWATDVHGSIVWAILFLHTLDAVADVVFTMVLIGLIAFRPYGARERLAVHVDSVLWYFIVGIWLPLYAVVYWGPHIVGTR
jgi:cytochrome c oxidase subunit 3